MHFEFTHGHFFSGLGGAAAGFNDAVANLDGASASFRCLGGIDVSPLACQDFARLTGAPATCLDLFTAEQYQRFHGKRPAAGWREATVDDIRRAYQNECPDALFLSAPCKGFSGLLGKTKAASDRYAALNELTVRGMWLAFEAFRDDPPALIFFENVPLIARRGRRFLDSIIRLLQAEGYSVNETFHDCGEIGGLAQHRRRCLLVARHEAKLPPVFFEPVKQRVRGVGEILGRLPLPGHAGLGPLHRRRVATFLTLIRLAMVPAGKDWRALQDLAVVDGQLRDFGLVPERRYYPGVLGVTPWDDPAATISGRGTPTNGAYAVQDPRLSGWGGRGSGRVTSWEEATGAVIAASHTGAGAFSVADPRPPYTGEYGQAGVVAWRDPAHAVTGQGSPGQGWISVQDPRVPWNQNAHRNKLAVVPWDGPAGTVIGASGNPADGGGSVADPRLAGVRHNNVFRVVRWGEAAQAVTAGSGPSSGSQAVADPRPEFGDGTHSHVFKITPWDEAAGAITTARHAAGGAGVVADPRLPAELHNGGYGVRPWEDPAHTIAGESWPSNGPYAVADPRCRWNRKPGDDWSKGGHYGVVDWQDPSGAVTAAAGHDSGAWSVADPRIGESIEEMAVPGWKERTDVVVLSPWDGCDHRPFTTLELAALQSLFDPDDLVDADLYEAAVRSGADDLTARALAFEPWTLAGTSDSRWREGIGNAVPRKAAKAIGEVGLLCLLAGTLGVTFLLSTTPRWARPIAVALGVASLHPEMD